MKDPAERKQDAVAIGELAEEWTANLELLPDLSPEELAQAEAEAQMRERQEADRRRLERAIGWGCPQRHVKRLLFGQVEDSEALAIVAKWRASSLAGAVLVLGGNPDSGKTLAATKAVLDGPPQPYLGYREWPTERHPRFVDIADVQRLGLYDRSGTLDQLVECSVLAIDDLGAEFDDRSGAMAALIDGLVNKRYRGGGWTVITTNLSPSAFRGRYGDRIMSRLQDDGCGFVRAKGQFRRRTTT